MEYCAVKLYDRDLSADGTAIAVAPLPYELVYELETRDGYVTSHVQAVAMGDGWQRVLQLEQSAAGDWRARVSAKGDVDLPPPGGDMSTLAGAVDCDIALSPLTNTMPVLRHGLLHVGGPLDFLMAWISVPDLHVHPSRQRYTFIRRDRERSVVRYESESRDFVADILFDADGLVLDYPGIGAAAAGASGALPRSRNPSHSDQPR